MGKDGKMQVSATLSIAEIEELVQNVGNRSEASSRRLYFGASHQQSKHAEVHTRAGQVLQAHALAGMKRSWESESEEDEPARTYEEEQESDMLQYEMQCAIQGHTHTAKRGRCTPST